MKDRFPGFEQCLAMMRQPDPQTQEEGFQRLSPHASEHVPELIEEFRKERDPGLRCGLLELIASARSADAFDFLAEQLRSDDPRLRYWAIWGLKKLDTNGARTLLREAKSFTFKTPEETEFFRTVLDTVLNKQEPPSSASS